MNKLNYKIETSKTDRRIFFTSSIMVFIILLLTATQFGVPDLELDNHLLSKTENLIETDFWNVNIDSLETDQEYFNNMAYYLMDEGYIWEVVELLDQFKLIEGIAMKYILLFSFLTVGAAQSYDWDDEKKIRGRRSAEKMENMIVWRLTDELDLSIDQAEKFFPRFREHRKNLEEIGRQEREMI